MKKLKIRNRNFGSLKIYAENDICVQGPAGTGKTKGIVIPIIRQYLKLGYSGIIYFEKPDRYLPHNLNYIAFNSGSDLFHIDFANEDVSEPLNPFSHEIILSLNIALTASQILFSGLTGWPNDEAEKSDVEMTVDYAGAVIWYLTKNSKGGCSMPLFIAFTEQEVELQVRQLQSMDDTWVITREICEKLESTGFQRCGPIQRIDAFLENINCSGALPVFSGSKFPRFGENTKIISIIGLGFDDYVSHKLANLIIYGSSVIESYNTSRVTKTFLAIDLSSDISSQYIYCHVRDNKDNPDHSTLLSYRGGSYYPEFMFDTYLRWTDTKPKLLERLKIIKKSLSNFIYSNNQNSKAVTVKHEGCGYKTYIPVGRVKSNTERLVNDAARAVSKINFKNSTNE